MKTFGLGCLYFGLTGEQDSIALARYIKDITKLLDDIPAVAASEIEMFGPFPEAKAQLISDADEPGENFNLTRTFWGLNIDFTLVIPLKAHDKYRPYESFKYHLKSEQYRVDIRYTYFGATCFVIPEKEEDDPSDAVILVREFLQTEIKKIGTRYKFICLGPSPLHIDFSFCSDKVGAVKVVDEFVFMREATAGYDNIKIIYADSKFADEQTAFSIFCDIADDELGLYYFICSLRAARIDAWAKVQDTVTKLLQIEKASGFGGFLKRVFERGLLSRRLFTDLALFKAEGIYMDGALNDSCRDLYKPGLKRYFENFIKEIRSDMPVYPEKEVTELATFVHETSSQLWDKTTVVLAAILGGIVGAMVTLLFSK